MVKRTKTKREIFGSFFTHVRGAFAYDADISRNEKLLLIREPDNHHDENAIAIHNSRKEKVGYISAARASYLADLLDSKKISIQGKVLSVRDDNSRQSIKIEISVYLLKQGQYIKKITQTQPATLTDYFSKMVIDLYNHPPEIHLIFDILRQKIEQESKKEHYMDLEKYLSQVNIQKGTEQVYGDMSIIFFSKDRYPKRDYITLDEAIKSKESFQVKEVSEDGSVPELRVINRLKKRVLFIDGEEGTGARQNRIINYSLIIEAAADTIIPVSCVEQGRWDYTKNRNFLAGSMAFPELRKINRDSIHHNMEVNNNLKADQSKVWDCIDIRESSLNMNTKTSAMSEMYEQYENELQTIKKVLNHPEKSCGYMAFINGKFVIMDLFDNHSTFKEKWTKLSQALILEFLDYKHGKKRTKKTTNTAARKKMHNWFTSKSKVEVFNLPGNSAKGIKIKEKDFTGSGLYDQDTDRIIHLSMSGN
jgi:hypothetical protein